MEQLLSCFWARCKVCERVTKPDVAIYSINGQDAVVCLPAMQRLRVVSWHNIA